MVRLHTLVGAQQTLLLWLRAANKGLRRKGLGAHGRLSHGVGRALEAEVLVLHPGRRHRRPLGARRVDADSLVEERRVGRDRVARLAERLAFDDDVVRDRVEAEAQSSQLLGHTRRVVCRADEGSPVRVRRQSNRGSHGARRASEVDAVSRGVVRPLDKNNHGGRETKDCGHAVACERATHRASQDDMQGMLRNVL